MNRTAAVQSQNKSASTQTGGILQRKCGCGTHTTGGATCSECGKNQLQRQPAGETRTNEIPPVVHNVLRSPGRPLDTPVRAFMEPRFGQDFSRVRVHTDSRAAQSAAAVNALAYTVGSNIVFGQGMYRPETAAGARLLAHEMAHVVQQRSITAPLGKYGIGPANSEHELQADRQAEHVMGKGSGAHLSALSTPVMQRAMICSKRLEAPVIGWFANHSYIDDTGRNDCKGSSMAGNYAIQTLVSGNFLRGCAAKTDHSTDPQSYTPNVKPCRPKSGVSDVSRCLRDAFNAYADPSVYSNVGSAAGAVAGGLVGGAAGAIGGAAIGSRLGPAGAVVGGIVGGIGGAIGGAVAGVAATSSITGPNSNTFAYTLANACCDDSSSSGLGLVPGWGHAPATPCPSSPTTSGPVMTA